MQKHGLGSYQIDIKETVHLSHQQLPIEEVEEMELVPQIEIAENGNEIEIIGNLYLYAEYRGNQQAGKLETAEDLPESYEESVQFEPLTPDRGPFSPLAREDRLEYRIPVQISLPRGKVREVEDVYAYINSFDYELRSPYQVEIQASLVIAGFTEQEAETATRNSWQEPLEFVHVAGEQAYAEEREEGKEEDVSPLIEAREEKEPEASLPEEEPSREMEQEREPEEAEKADNVIPLPFAGEGQRPQTEETEGEGVEEEEPERENENGEEEAVQAADGDAGEERVEAAEEIREKEDVKVAISKKGVSRDREKISSLSSVFGKMHKREDAVPEVSNARPEEAESQRDHGEASAGREGLYLTNFMEQNEERFTKVKICILQRNETLEEVADRYNLSVETILRANKTARNQVGAGQLLYIPVKG